MLEIINPTQVRINDKLLQSLAQQVLSFYNLSDHSLTLILVGPSKMKTLNKTYRLQAKSTDVLAFSDLNNGISENQVIKASDQFLLASVATNKFLGEIFINKTDLNKFFKYKKIFPFLENFSLIKDQVKAKQLVSEYILNSLFVHGLLHLIGYHDDTENKRLAMIKIGEGFVNKAYKNFAKLCYNCSN